MAIVILTALFMIKTNFGSGMPSTKGMQAENVLKPYQTDRVFMFSLFPLQYLNIYHLEY